MKNTLDYWQMLSISFPCNDGHPSPPIFHYFYADLYCYANAAVTYPIAVLLIGPEPVLRFVNVIVWLPHMGFTALL